MIYTSVSLGWIKLLEAVVEQAERDIYCYNRAHEKNKYCNVSDQDYSLAISFMNNQGKVIKDGCKAYRRELSQGTYKAIVNFNSPE